MYICNKKMKNQKVKELIKELNEIRSNQKSINQFSSVKDWLNYGKEIAVKKALILAEIEKLTN